MTKTLDQLAGEKLGLHPEQVGAYRGEWEKSPTSNVVKALMAAKLDSLIRERENKLRTCSPEELRKVQGELNGLQLALDVVNARLI